MLLTSVHVYTHKYTHTSIHTRRHTHTHTHSCRYSVVSEIIYYLKLPKLNVKLSKEIAFVSLSCVVENPTLDNKTTSLICRLMNRIV